jgi:exosome complex component RRP46
MRGVICAVAVARLHTTTTTPSTAYLVLDPGDSELASATASGCFAFLFAYELGAPVNASNSCACRSVWVNWQADGSFTQDELMRAQELAKGGAERVWQAMKDSVPSMSAQPQQWKDLLRARSHANDDAMETS